MQVKCTQASMRNSTASKKEKEELHPFAFNVFRMRGSAMLNSMHAVHHSASLWSLLVFWFLAFSFIEHVLRGLSCQDSYQFLLAKDVKKNITWKGISTGSGLLTC